MSFLCSERKNNFKNMKNVSLSNIQSEGDSSHSTTDGQVLVGAPQMVQGQSKDLEAKPSREKNSIFRAKPMKVKHHKHSAGPLAEYGRLQQFNNCF